MTQSNQPINSHVETYLDYYCELSHAPEFAVLLKGQWGAGKTWFIDRYIKKLEEKSRRCLYVSLYGMTSLSDIDDTFFQLLHPIRSSKGMVITILRTFFEAEAETRIPPLVFASVMMLKPAFHRWRFKIVRTVVITEKIIKGLLKGSLKIDLNADGKEDGAWSIQIPDIKLPEHLKDINKSILIFDDLERCNIEISSVFGYINHFVEHQELKVIIIANEDKFSKDGIYKEIKEKLIGKTFDISPDFEGALESFVMNVENSEVRRFLSDSTELIRDLYSKAEYENLRNLKQIVLDFERIFALLPKKARNKLELLQDFLRLLMAFSIEIKRGAMHASDISKLLDEYTSGISKRYGSAQASNAVLKSDSEGQTSLQKILDRYTAINLYDPFPSAIWWQTFFDKGITDSQELEQSVLNSKYFQDEETPDWKRLWHFSGLSDDDFDSLIAKVELEYSNREFTDLGVIIHITGLFLSFSDAGIYHKSKKEILENSKLYIDCLKDSSRLESSSQYVSSSKIDDHLFESYLRLGFQGKEFEEFKEFTSYICKALELVKVESMPSLVQSLLSTMESDVWKFYSLICLPRLGERYELDHNYYRVPIFKYIEPDDFMQRLLLMKYEDRQHVFAAIKERYKFGNIDDEFLEELECLKAIQVLLLKEAGCRKGKVSGYCLELLNTHYLSGVIKKLEKI